MAGHLANTDLGGGVDGPDGRGNSGNPLIVDRRAGGLTVAVRFVGQFVGKKRGMMANGINNSPNMREIELFIAVLVPRSGIRVNRGRKNVATAVAVIGQGNNDLDAVIGGDIKKDF